MAVFEELPNTNLKAVDIRDTLLANGADWSTSKVKDSNYLPNYFNKEAKINIWSRYKPVKNYSDATRDKNTGFFVQDTQPTVLKYEHTETELALHAFRGYKPKSNPFEIKKTFTPEAPDYDILVSNTATSANVPIRVFFPSIPLNNFVVGSMDTKLRITRNIWGMPNDVTLLHEEVIDRNNAQSFVDTNKSYNISLGGMPTPGNTVSYDLYLSYGGAYFESVESNRVTVSVHKQWLQNPSDPNSWNRNASVHGTSSDYQYREALFLPGRYKGDRSGLGFEDFRPLNQGRYVMYFKYNNIRYNLCTFYGGGGNLTDLQFYNGRLLSSSENSGMFSFKVVLDEQFGYNISDIYIESGGL